MGSNNKIIEVKNIIKVFPGTVALGNVDFDLNKGEVHAIVGENGAGKTTLIKILSGVYTKTSGEVFFNGKEQTISSTRQALDLGISVIYQELENMGKLSVAENIYLGRLPKSKKAKGFVNFNTLYKETKELLERLKININPKEIVGNLSIAEQQLVEIAKSLSHEVKVLIMDEPTSYLNKDETDALFKTIRDIKSHGVSIIYVSHRLQEVLEIADRITVLRDGKNVSTIEDVRDINEYEIIKLIVGQKSHEILQQKQSGVERKNVVFEVRNLSIYRRLKNFDMKLCEGEILGIAGLTGSGKDELIQSLVGLWPITSGEFFVFGKKVKIKYPNDAINLGIVYLPEERKAFSIFPTMNCRENISPIWLFKIYKKIFLSIKKELNIAKEYMDKLSVKTSSTEASILSLSGGNQQKLIFARMLTFKPKILLLHDPTRGIDVGSKSEIYNIINNLAKQGTSILFLSSELQEICNLAHRIKVIINGQFKEEFVGSEINMESVLTSVTTTSTGGKNE